MRCFAWNTQGTCADLLASLPPLEGGKAILSSRFFVIPDPLDAVEYIVLVYDRETLIPADYDQAKATTEFLQMLQTIVIPCGV